MKKVRVTNVKSSRFDTTVTLCHDYFQLLNPYEIASAVEYYLNKEQTKPTMKEKDLLPFDLEEAKKDPSRIRFTDKAIAKEIHIFYNGRVSAVWEDGDFAIYADYTKLRLTPKRRFVNICKTNKGEFYADEDICDSIEHAREVGKDLSNSVEILELIPVKEDE